MTRIAVIGGGIAGVSAAAALSDDGHQVTVYEAEGALGYHASGRSAALFDQHYGNEPVRALNAMTRPYLEAEGVLSPRGLLCVGLPDEEVAFEADCSDLGLTQMSVDEARAMVPILSPDICRAGYYPDAMDIDTDRLLQSFARDARAKGAVIHLNAPVEYIRPGFTIVAGGDALDVDIVVNAAGAWADRVAELAGIAPIGLQPYRRSMARMPAPGGHDVSDWPMLFGPGESWYAKPDAGNWIVSPADEDPSEPMDAWADDMVLAEGIARYQSHVSEPVTRVETSWAGLRTFAPDRSLVIGEDPTCSGFFWLAGQGGYGFQTSAGAARHLAAQVSGYSGDLASEMAGRMSPARFRSGQAKVGV